MTLSRTTILLYGSFCYLLFLGTFLYAIAFVEGWVPGALDATASGAGSGALLVDLGLLGLFAVQHTVMARRGFKRWWIRIVPSPAERSTFVLATCAVLGLLFWQWRPLPGVVWETEGLLAVLLRTFSLAGWGIALLSTCLIDHLGLFGLRQAWLHFRGRPRPRGDFQLCSLYRVVRHPLMLGFLVAFWAAPRMTAGHLLFAAVTTAYVLVAIRIEERDLVAEHGEAYAAYQRSVPMLLPRPGRRAPVAAPGGEHAT